MKVHFSKKGSISSYGSFTKVFLLIICLMLYHHHGPRSSEFHISKNRDLEKLKMIKSKDREWKWGREGVGYEYDIMHKLRKNNISTEAVSCALLQIKAICALQSSLSFCRNQVSLLHQSQEFSILYRKCKKSMCRLFSLCLMENMILYSRTCSSCQNHTTDEATQHRC